MRNRDRFYVAGEWVLPTGTDTLDVFDSSDGSLLGRIPAGTADDANRAVAAARAAFESWSQTPNSVRAKFCLAIADGLNARADELADVIIRETGMPVALSPMVQVAGPVGVATQAASLAENYVYDEQVGNSIIAREPVGVVACITPWNFPLSQAVAKVAYALAAGCTVVLKPSEIAPLDAFILADVIDEVGLPAGVFNLVVGTGAVVGEALAAHPEVDMISFTGSTRAGRRVAELASQGLKRVALELGGKSANILLDDLDDAAFETAVREGVGKCYLNSGQFCASLSRMLVPRSRVADAERIAADEALTTWQPGDPFAATTMLGPLASQAQVDRVNGYVRQGVEGGAKLVVGGPQAPAGLGAGYFVNPTVFSNVTNDMTIAQEEIFGPVLSIIAYDDDNEAVRIANDSPYGLYGAVAGADSDRAQAVARRIRTGQVEVNGGAPNMEAPWGGYKQSGYGREFGRHGFEEFLEIKSMQC
jgi:aldehyde dehydrogenase (NAD+)